MSATYQPPRYITGTEQAKMIRAALKAEFPGVKFSVRQSRGSAIYINWTDGPTNSAVQAVGDRYRGGGFDGIQDLRYSIDTLLTTEDGGEVVRFSADFVFATREISDTWKNEILDLFEATIGRSLGDREAFGFWNQFVPLSVDRFEGGRLLHMREQDSSYLNDVYHQYTAPRAR